MKLRITSGTALNPESSRSHAIISVHMTKEEQQFRDLSNQPDTSQKSQRSRRLFFWKSATLEMGSKLSQKKQDTYKVIEAASVVQKEGNIYTFKHNGIEYSFNMIGSIHQTDSAAVIKSPWKWRICRRKMSCLRKTAKDSSENEKHSQFGWAWKQCRKARTRKLRRAFWT